MQDHGERGSIVTLLCDSGDRYVDTYYQAAWRTKHHLECEREIEQMHALMERGEWCSQLLEKWRVAGMLVRDAAS